MKKSVIPVLLVLSLILAGSSFADGTRTTTLETVIVTATKTEQNIDEAPASKNVITRADIENLNVSSVVEVLRHIPGAYVNTSSTGSVVMRGLSGQNRTLILVNGIPMNDGYSGSVDWKTLSIENIERVEVIRGGGSALYGGNAMGGVINIITTRAKKLEAGLHCGFGNDNTYRYGGYAGNRVGKFGIRAGYEAESTDGYANNLIYKTPKTGSGTLTGGHAMTLATGSDVWVVGDSGDNNQGRTNFNLMLDYGLTDTGSLTLDFQRGTQSQEYDRPNTYISDASGNPVYSGNVDIGNGQYVTASAAGYLKSPYEKEDYVTSLKYRERFGSLDFTATGGYKIMDTWYTTAYSGTFDDASGERSDYGTKTWTGELQADLPLGDSHLLTTGFHYRHDDFDKDNYGVTYYRNEDSITGRTSGICAKAQFYAVYVQDEWHITETWRLFMGGRLDYWTAFDAVGGNQGSESAYAESDKKAISPKISTVWHPLADTYVRGSVSKSFRPPTVNELYSTSTMSGNTYHNNPDLDPETAWTYEAGADQYLWDRKMKLSATGFYTRAEDFIQSYWGTSTDSYKENVGEAEIYGLELEISASPLEWLDVWGNFTFTESEVLSNPLHPSYVGKHLTYFPAQTFNVGCDAAYKKFKLSLAANYTGRFYTTALNSDSGEGYCSYDRRWLVDTKLSYRPLKNVECAFSVNNLFDKEYYTYSIAPGRTFMFEVKVDFPGK